MQRPMKSTHSSPYRPSQPKMGKTNIPERTLPTQTEEKPTFQQLRQDVKTLEGQPITRQTLATLTGLSLGEVYIIDIGGYSPQENVRKVLYAFNRLTGQSLTIASIQRRGMVS